MSTNTMLHSVVDADFRDVLVNTYGIAADSLPTTVEQPDQDALDFWTEGISAMDIYACVTSCSWGPFTIVCDGNTKNN